MSLFSKGAVYEAARALQQVALTGDLTGVDARCAAVQDELLRVCADLEALLTTLS